MELGFGIMRFGNYSEMIDYNEVNDSIDEYMKEDYCYFDVHPDYVNGEAQRIVKEYVVNKYSRERIIIADKMPYYGISSYVDYDRIFNSELFECGIEYFDYYMLHAVSADVDRMHNKYGGYEFIKKKKSEGFVKKIGISFHGSPELLDDILSKHKELDFVQLQINWLDWDDQIICSKKNYEIAVKHGKRVIVMEPLKGGTLLKNNKENSSIKMGFYFLTRLKNVDVVLSGMTNAKQVRENRSIFRDFKSITNNNEPIDMQVYEELRRKYKGLSLIKCTSCKYCVRECPMSIPIPDIMHLLNTYATLSNGEHAFLGGSVATYISITHEKGKSGECIGCGKCEIRCPQKLEIRKYMKQAKNTFENNSYYSAERNVQILVYLLKENGIRNIVISPGTTNMCFVQSVQYDDYFNVFSVVDERSAAYIATGMARESGKPVVLSCTGATASRNYISALTEAYYSKLPLIAVTSSQHMGRVGHLIPQVIDRKSIPNDIVYLSVELPLINDNDEESEWLCGINANKAILAALDGRKGPVHVNLITSYNPDFSVKKLMPVKAVRKHRKIDVDISQIKGRIAIFCGAHEVWKADLTRLVDAFCEKYNAIVISDHTGNYNGKYGITNSLVLAQEGYNLLNDFGLIIHIGYVSGAYYNLKTECVWRVNPDGEIVDTFRKLTDVFEMSEESFFRDIIMSGTKQIRDSQMCFIDEWKEMEKIILEKIPELPFSNIWIAQKTIKKLPKGSEIHFAILNSLRAWNFFEKPDGINAFANTGGFGIDGCLSTLVGASLMDKEKLFFGIVGDLAFFYDMNVLGNRHLGNNLRIILVNNGCGAEFYNYNHPVSVLSESEKGIIAANGHYSNKSRDLVRLLAQSLGFKYMSANNKSEYLANLDEFVSNKQIEQSIIFEVFTKTDNESEALERVNTIMGKMSIKTVGSRESHIPERFRNNFQELDLVLWGTGYYYKKNIEKIKQRVNPLFVCDNNEEKWGKKIEGILCESPQKLKEIDHPFVVIMVQEAKTALQIVNQLIEMGITEFDLYDNWRDYAKDLGFYD